MLSNSGHLIAQYIFPFLLAMACTKIVVTENEVKNELPNTILSKSSPKASNLIFEETFEGAKPFSNAHSIEVGNWKYAMQFVTKPVFQGKKAVRFEIRKDQPLVKTGKRAEACIVKGSLGHIAKETWYSFSVYCPKKGYEFDTDREVINQWYQEGTPAMTIRTHKDRFLLESGNTVESRKQYDLGPIKKDSWSEFVLHVIHSFQSDGFIEIWRDGTKIRTVKGGNMYNGILPKWKIGLYKAGFKTEKSKVTRRIIYFDNVRVGNANASFKEMTSLK